jgi:transposase
MLTHGPVYLVVDGHPTHRSKLVKQFVASTDGRLKLFVLPAYSPQLNPDEWVCRVAGGNFTLRLSPRVSQLRGGCGAGQGVVV